MIFETGEKDGFLARHAGFFEFVINWRRGLKPIRLAELTNEGANPRRLVILSEDLVKGFTTVGRLASPRIAAVVPRVVRLFEAAYAAGVRDFVLPHDAHPPDSSEFDAFGPHCVKGTIEAQTIDELAGLPFADEFAMMPKQSLDPSIGTELDKWFDDRPLVGSVIVVGDCTDFCVYQAAMHLRVRADATGRKLEVIVPEDCVQTYDFTIEDAGAGGMPHDGDVFHLLFLYHMALSGVRVVAGIEE